MESLAFIHSAAAYESGDPAPQLRNFDWDQLLGAARTPAQTLLISALIISAAGSALAQTAGSDGTDASFNSADFIERTVLAQTQKLQVGSVKTDGKPLNVRDRPDGMVLGTLPDGSRVELTGKEQGGFLERSNGTWVDQQFIQIQPAGSKSSPEAVSPLPEAVAPSPSPVAVAPSPTLEATALSPSPVAVAPSPSPEAIEPDPATSPSPAAAAITPLASPSPAAARAAVKTGVVKTSGAPLNLRDRPNGAAIGTLPNNISVNLTGKEQDGFVELTNGAWADKQYISLRSAPASAPQSTPATAVQAARGTSGTIRTSGGELNVRRSPAGEVVGALPNGTRVELTGRNVDGWLQRTDGTWVFGQFVSYSSSTPAPTPAPQPPVGGDVTVGTVRTSGGELNVRRSPGGAVIGSIPNGARVELTGRSTDGWLQRTDGTWVSAQFVSTSTATRPTPSRPPVGSDVSTGVIRTNGNALNVRQSPGGGIIGSVANGSRVELTGRKESGWLQLSNGGWVAADWVVTE